MFSQEDTRIKILQQVTEMVHSSLDLEKIFKHITNGIVHFMGFTTAIFFMLNKEQTRFEVKALTTKKGLLTLIDKIGGFSIKNFSIPAELTLNAAVRSAMNGQIVVAKTLEEIAYPLISKRQCADLQKLGKTKNLIILPLEIDGEMAGGVFITSKQDKIPVEELEMIKSFSHAASNAIKNADLHQQIKKAYEEIKHSQVAQKQAGAEIKRSHEELKKLTVHLQTVREEERTLVAYELHDDIGQGLSALKMDLYMLEEKLPEERKDLAERFQKTKDLLDNIIQTTRKIYSDLRPTLLEHFSIKEVIEDHVKKFQDLTKIKGGCKIDLGKIRLDENFSLVLFRIVQEALNNVKWHSQASEVTVILEKKNNNIELTIKDDGIGIKEADLNRPSSFGIIGMRERASLLGGRLEVRAAPKKGTSVSVHLPLK